MRSSIIHLRSSYLSSILCAATILALAGCRQDMHDQPKYRPLRPIDQFGSINDGRSARPLVDGTVARDELKEDVEFYTGKLRQAAQSGSSNTMQETAAPPMQSGQTSGQTLGQMYQGFVTEF